MELLRKTLIVVITVILAGQAAPTYGQYWQEMTPAGPWPARYGHAAVVYHGEIFLLGGASEGSGQYFNDVWRSADGEQWIQVTAGAPWAPREISSAVVFEDRIWIMGGIRQTQCFNDVWCSTDGVNWERKPDAPWSPRYGHCPLVFDGRIWILGGALELGGSYVNDAWYTVLPRVSSGNFGSGFVWGLSRLLLVLFVQPADPPGP